MDVKACLELIKWHRREWSLLPKGEIMLFDLGDERICRTAFAKGGFDFIIGISAERTGEKVKLFFFVYVFDPLEVITIANRLVALVVTEDPTLFGAHSLAKDVETVSGDTLDWLLRQAVLDSAAEFERAPDDALLRDTLMYDVSDSLPAARGIVGIGGLSDRVQLS